jgi:hypothetical protein
VHGLRIQHDAFVTDPFGQIPGHISFQAATFAVLLPRICHDEGDSCRKGSL